MKYSCRHLQLANCPHDRQVYAGLWQRPLKWFIVHMSHLLIILLFTQLQSLDMQPLTYTPRLLHSEGCLLLGWSGANAGP